MGLSSRGRLVCTAPSSIRTVITAWRCHWPWRARLLTAKRLDGWTVLFLATTVATSVTGFGFPFERVLPSHVVRAISLVVQTIAILARYARHLAGSWRWIYIVSAVIALYLNVFVFVAQLFLKVPARNALAPTQSEPPFKFTQNVVLLIFVALAAAAAIRFRSEPVRTV